jgi:CheY-like chemotaxis protein
VTANTVLIVDDDPDIRSALQELLEDEGYQVVGAENGKTALAYVEAGLRPCAIVLDIMMPVMDGWDFRAQQLQNAAIRNTPVVVITAAGFSSDTIRRQFGEVEFVAKPPPLDSLLAAVRRACAEKKSPPPSTTPLF